MAFALLLCCQDPVYEQSSFFPSMFTLIPQRGLSNYLAGAYTEFTNTIVGKPLFKEITLEIIGMKLQIKNLVVMTLTTDQLAVRFPTADTMELKAANLSMQLYFEFALRQQSFPYLEDDGNGTINMQDVTFSIQAGFEEVENCRFGFQLNTEYSDMFVKTLKMKMSGSLSFIYDSILSMLGDKIRDVLNEEIGKDLVSTLIEAANSALRSFKMQHPTEKPSYVADAGFLHPPKIVDRAMWIAQIGYMMKNVNNTFLQLYDNAEAYTPPPAFMTNEDVQTFVSIFTFRSAFQAYLSERNRTFTDGEATYALNEMNAARFVKTGLLFTLTFFDDDGKKSMVEILSQVHRLDHSVHSFKYGLSFNKIISCGGVLCMKDSLTTILDQIKTEMTPFWFLQGKAQVFDFNRCTTAYLDANWMFYGCNMLTEQ